MNFLGGRRLLFSYATRALSRRHGTWITVMILNKTRLSRFIAFPSLTFIAIMVGYVVAIDSFYIQF